MRILTDGAFDSHEHAQESGELLIAVTKEDVLVLRGALREALEAVEDWEFQTRVGVPKSTMRALLAAFGAAPRGR